MGTLCQRYFLGVSLFSFPHAVDMSVLWYATAIAAITSAFFSIASEMGFLPSPAKTQPVTAHTQSATTASTHPKYEQAMAYADQAVFAYQNEKQAQDLSVKADFARRERSLWQTTLQRLAEVPASADIYSEAAEKQVQYQALLANAEGKLIDSENAVLAAIAADAGAAPEQVHITLCQIGLPLDATAPVSTSRQCRHHQGDSDLASAASLIKLPIAIALMDKIEQEGKSLNHEIYIDPQNFTENAEGVGIEVDREYTLSQVMTRMINESNNIATNQLIDYIGRDTMAKTMAARGYSGTLIDFKLAGDRILPPNPGTQSNRLTSNDLTAMMVEIYGLENPGDEDLLRALFSQQDKEIGYTALKDFSPGVDWLGEKTGQNERLIGSTLAMKVGSQRYALTVAIDNSSDIYALRDIIRGIAAYLKETGPINGKVE